MKSACFITRPKRKQRATKIINRSGWTMQIYGENKGIYISKYKNGVAFVQLLCNFPAKATPYNKLIN